MRRSRIAQKDPKQTIGDHGAGAILASPSALHLYPVVKVRLDLVVFEKFSYQTASSKSSEIFTGELFFNIVILLLAFVVFLRYNLFHLLSASSVVSWFFAEPIITTVGGIFVRKN